MCCFAVSQLLTFGKSIISLANKTEDEEVDDDKANIEWPEDISAKAKIIRINAQTMIGYLEAVSNSFTTGWLSIAHIYDHNHVVLKTSTPWVDLVNYGTTTFFTQTIEQSLTTVIF